jgi:UDP-N-acetylglucosamine 2-epimerase (non-hydrolysing)
VFGTRPEAVKLLPVVEVLRTLECPVRVCVTGQHREMLDQVLDAFKIRPDVRLDVMTTNQTLGSLTSEILRSMEALLRVEMPARVVVQGDTTTTMAASLSAFYARIPVAHVEAGLRTGNLHSPWPEELNRRFTTILADLHFAPTNDARDHLLREGVPAANVHVTGNTIVDALHQMLQRIETDAGLRSALEQQFRFIPADARMIVVTGHRRESFHGGLESTFEAIGEIARRHPDVVVVFPVHLNPNVQSAVQKTLAGMNRVHLIEPLAYLPFVYLMSRAHLLITDSGGVQEEAPTLR